ncbi:MAG: hypothetical protein JO316_15580 [Abitibacteriaceae bacterium]|nr:hypothetical protein [Abditibacteriaceae bacterium]
MGIRHTNEPTADSFPIASTATRLQKVEQRLEKLEQQVEKLMAQQKSAPETDLSHATPHPHDSTPPTATPPPHPPCHSKP